MLSNYEKIKINVIMGTEYSYISQVYGLDKLLNGIKEVYLELIREDVEKINKEIQLKSKKINKDGKKIKIMADDNGVSVEFEDNGIVELGIITSKGLLGRRDDKYLEFDVYEYNSEVYEY